VLLLITSRRTGSSPAHGSGVSNRTVQTLCLKQCIRPAAERAKITKHIGWHTFRRTFSTLLKANGEDVKTVQELLRHATVKMTLEVYTQAVTPAKRNAQSKVVGMLKGGGEMKGFFLLDPKWTLENFGKPVSC
jgi:integrase